MQPAAQQSLTCSTCGRALEKTRTGELRCPVCLLQAGLGGEQTVAQDLSPNDVDGATRFGVYEIERHADGSLYELGRGAMGITYRAIDTSLQRKVALKIIKTDVAAQSADARERFMREARAAAALRHENVAVVHQFGIREESGQYFYAMELIEGETLEERVRRAGPLSIRTTIDIGQQVTAALAAAEKRGLVHRDLKPANLMLVSLDRDTTNFDRKDEKFVVKIIDFGLAKALDAPGSPLSLTGDKFVGTPAFASPEQFEHSALDVRSDIYSLGETLWFALTGKTPFAGHSVQEIHRAQQSHAPPIEQLKAAHVASRLRSLLASMLAFEPASRPGTQELAARLQRCSPEARSAQRTRVTLAVAGLVILCALAVMTFLWVRTQNSISNLGSLDKSIAVLPFQNRSEDKANAYFADGIQDEVLTRLSNIADLKVISRTSTQQYQGNPGNLREIAKQLGVTNILEGSVQKIAHQVRVNVQLINAQTDSHLWADTYDRKLTDILGVESEISKRIAESLQAKLTGREEKALAAKPTNNPEAYDAYLRGLAYEARSHYPYFIRDLLSKAVSFYEQAVKLDPNFAIAWARLSRAEAFLYFGPDGVNLTAQAEAAKIALDNAQNLEPNSPETLLALGYYQYWVLRDYEAAKSAFEGVVKISPPNSELSSALGRIAQREGHWDQSVAYHEQALSLDPRNLELLTNTAWTYTMLRQFPAVLRLCDRALDISPNEETIPEKASIYQAEGKLQEAAKLLSSLNEQSPNETFGIKIDQLRLERNYGEAIRLLQARLSQFHFASEEDRALTQSDLAFTQRLAGDMAGAKLTAEQACNTLERLYGDQPDNAYRAAQLSQAYMLMENKDRALKEAERAVMLSPRAKDAIEGPAAEENLALIRTIVGDNSRAISTLALLLQTPYNSWFYSRTPVTPALLRLDPVWDPLRSDPRFQKLCDETQSLLSGPTQIPEKSIAVLPFENLSDEKANAYFADGVQDEILTDLAKVADLKVISRTSVMQYKSGVTRNLREIGQQLGVANVVEGSVQRSANRVRVNAKLVDARSDRQLWGQTYDRDLADVFAIQSEIAKTIADQLQAELSPNEKKAIEQPPTTNLAAFDPYSRAKSLLLTASFSATSDRDVRNAIELLDEAVKRDPSFFDAYCQLAYAHEWLYARSGLDHTAARLALAEAAVQAAIRLRPDAPESHLARAQYLYYGLRDYAGALAELEIARRALPNDPRLFELTGYILWRRGQQEKGLHNLERAVELDPRNFDTLQQIALSYQDLRRYAESIAALDRALAILPDNAETRADRGLVYLFWKADPRPLRQTIDAIFAQRPDAIVSAAVIWFVGALAERDPAAAERALVALGNNPSVVEREIILSHTLGEGLLARMTKDEPRARTAFEAARTEQEKIVQAQPDYGPALCVLGLIDAALGRKDLALQEGRRAIELTPLEQDVIIGCFVRQYFAITAAWAGDKELAMQQLESGLRAPVASLLLSYGGLKLMPFWDPLRDDARFEKIVASLAPKPQ